MRIETVLNHVHRFKSFVYESVRWERTESEQDLLVAKVIPRKNGKPKCSGCGALGSVYDHQPEARRFAFVPIWKIPMELEYRMRRVDCGRCGIRVECVPWAIGKRPLTKAFAVFLAQWAKPLCWQETAIRFGVSWDMVSASVKWVVEYGLSHRDLSGIRAIGVDEVQYRKGHKYLTLLYQIDGNSRRLLCIQKDRGVRSLLRCFRELGDHAKSIQFVCSDMWKPYIKVLAKKVPQALHVLDRFHIAKLMGDALDKVRREEVRNLKGEGLDHLLKGTKYCFLKRPENLTENQKARLNDVIGFTFRTVKAYLFKEAFQHFWEYSSPYWANWYLDRWCTRVMRSRIEPMKKFVKTLRRHRPLILNYFKAKKQISNGVVEGMNRKINLVTRKSYGFRNYEHLKIALFHELGELPTPKLTHSFF